MFGLLPRELEFFDPTGKIRFEEIIVFVPFFGGSKHNLKRHIEWAQTLGFRCAAFNLTYRGWAGLARLPYAPGWGWGLKYVWSREIGEVLDQVQGAKILYAFSNPSSCAVGAIVRRQERSDVKALVCDSGPFVDIEKCNFDLLELEYGIKSPFLRGPLNKVMSFLWGRDHNQTLIHDLESLPKGFQVFSIRGGRDPLVPKERIEMAFEKATQLALTTLELPQAQHLNGLRDFGMQYTQAVEKFLESVSKGSISPSPRAGP